MRYALAAIVFTLSLPLAAMEVGGVMPALDQVRWVSGDAGESQRITVLDLWSPTNPACRATMPRLTDLAKRHRDQVRVLGLCEGDADQARGFVSAMGSRASYAIGVAPSLKPFAPSVGAPCTLLIDAHGTVLWWGDALNVAEPLARVLDGTFVAEPIPPPSAPESKPSGAVPRTIEREVVVQREVVVDRGCEASPRGSVVIISPYGHWCPPRIEVPCPVPFFLPRPPLPLLWSPWRHCR